MLIIGLTGSIATGKTFVAKCFAKLGAAVFDADETVHDLLTYGGEVVGKVREVFPESYIEGCICRKTLGKIVFNDAAKRKILESIIHPIVATKREAFINSAKTKRVGFVVLEIPLLFESEVKTKCDYTIVTVADYEVQKSRALEREGMSLERFNKINSLQLASSEKVKLADYVIDTNTSEFSVFRRVKQIISEIKVRDAGSSI